MKTTNQWPNYELVGLSKEENVEFWQKENKIFNLFLKFLNFMIHFTFVLFSLNYFMVSYLIGKVDLIVIIIVNSLNIIHVYINLIRIFHVLNIFIYFYLVTIKFFTTKFRFLKREICELAKHQTISNTKLSKLLFDFNYVYLEMVNMNEYLKYIIGLHLVHYFVLSVNLSFAIFLTDLPTQIAFAQILIFLYIFIVYLSCQWSNSFTKELEKTNFILQTIAFRPEVSLRNRKKINFISFFLGNEKCGFTFFDLFKLTSSDALTVSS